MSRCATGSRHQCPAISAALLSALVDERFRGNGLLRVFNAPGGWNLNPMGVSGGIPGFASGGNDIWYVIGNKADVLWLPEMVVCTVQLLQSPLGIVSWLQNREQRIIGKTIELLWLWDRRQSFPRLLWLCRVANLLCDTVALRRSRSEVVDT